MMIIQRTDLTRRIENSRKWVFIYGRRKTGKTYIVENTVKYDEFFFVNRNRSILDKKNNQIMNYETFTILFRRLLANNQTVVIDEFHRLGDEFLDILHSVQKRGKLILITSTLFLARKLLTTRSPIMGLFNEIMVDIIPLDETLKELCKFQIQKKDLLELSIFAREPLAIDYMDGLSPTQTISEILLGSLKAIPALVGEIFREEERSLTMVYNGILSAVATGNISSGKISSFLFSRRLIQKDDPSIIQTYLGNLIKIGVLKKIIIFNKNRFAYKISSPLIRLFFYAEEKFAISDRSVSGKEIEEILSILLPRIVEDNVREIISLHENLVETIIGDSDYDVDGYLLHFERPQIALEVKWGDKENDISKIENKLLTIIAEKRVLFVTDRTNLRSEKISLMDVSDLVSSWSDQNWA
ncbi:MAG: AAA family ATPase [Thermoplasmataceae archaeon]